MTETSNWKPLDFQCSYKCLYCPESGHNVKPKLRDDWAKIPRSRYGVTVCNDTDLFAPEVPDHIINKILHRARAAQDHYAYVFYTKNPSRYKDFYEEYPRHTLFAITVESDIDHEFSKAPPPLERLEAAKEWRLKMDMFKEVCLSVQPIMDFSPLFVKRIREVNPSQVSIGRDLFNYLLPEPSLNTVKEFARELNLYTTVLLRGQRVYFDWDDQDWIDVWGTVSEA